MRSRTRAALYDAAEACETIQRYCEGKDEDGFRSDELLVAAVEMLLIRLGAALRQLGGAEPDTDGRLTGLRRLVQFSSDLVHRYREVEPRQVWRVVEGDTRSLADELRNWLAEIR